MLTSMFTRTPFWKAFTDPRRPLLIDPVIYDEDANAANVLMRIPVVLNGRICWRMKPAAHKQIKGMPFSDIGERWTKACIITK